MTIVSGTVAIALLMIGCDNVKKAAVQADMAGDLNNLKQVKFALDGFSADFDGQYPNEQTHRKLMATLGPPQARKAETIPPPTTANDYFTQLFLSGETESESIFWVQGASVCNESPPDNQIEGAMRYLDPARILEKGDCGTAYVLNQKILSDRRRALLVSAYKKGTTEFDPDLYREGDISKVLVGRVDGSLMPVTLDPSGKLLDEDGADLLKDAKCWDGEPPVIVQPAQ